MELQDENILFFCRTMGQGGTEKVVLQLCDILKPLVNSITICSVGGEYVERLAEQGIKHYLIPDIDNKDVGTFTQVTRTVKQIIKQEHITIIHSHHRMAALYARLCTIGKPIKLVAHGHVIFQDKKLLTRLAYGHTQMIACGDHVYDNLVNYFGIPAQRVRTISNAVKRDPAPLVPDPQLTALRQQGKTLIGNIGRLEEQKGIDVFLKAGAKLRETFADFTLIIIGDGSLKADLQQQVADLKLEGHVVFLGYRNDVQNLIKQLDYVVLSSRWEGFPLTPIETFACGKTVIATDIPGTNAIIHDQRNGLLVPMDDATAMATAMQTLAADADLRAKLEAGAVASYAGEFSYERFAEKTRGFYRELAQG